MKEYRVYVRAVEDQVWIVEAESAEEAQENFRDGNMLFADTDFEEVTGAEET